MEKISEISGEDEESNMLNRSRYVLLTDPNNTNQNSRSKTSSINLIDQEKPLFVIENQGQMVETSPVQRNTT